MGIGKAKCDFSEFVQLRKKVADATNNIDDVLTSLTKEIVLRLLRNTKKRTPVRKGALRQGWNVGSVKKNGGAYTVEIYNNVEYAPYVEYGHRTKNHTGWVRGRYMLTISEKEINSNVDKIVRTRLEMMLSEVFNDK